MSDLPTRSEMGDYLRGNFEGYSKEKYDWLLAVGWGYADGELKTAAESIPPPLTCNCGQCGRMHDSDCAVHSEPAYPKGACTCEGIGENTS